MKKKEENKKVKTKFKRVAQPCMGDLQKRKWCERKLNGEAEGLRNDTMTHPPCDFVNVPAAVAAWQV